MNKGLVKAILKLGLNLLLIVGLIALVKVDFKMIYISGVVGVIVWVVIKSLYHIFRGEY